MKERICVVCLETDSRYWFDSNFNDYSMCVFCTESELECLFIDSKESEA